MKQLLPFLCAVGAWLHFSQECLAGDAAFSADGRRIYAILEGEKKPALREIDLTSHTTRKFLLTPLSDRDGIRGVACSNEGRIYCLSARSIWTFDPGAGRLTKVKDAPSGTSFYHLAYNPKTQDILLTTDGRNDSLWLLKNGREMVPVFVRRYSGVNAPVFTEEGELFYGGIGDLWSGRIESEEGRYWLSATRYLPLAYQETDNTTPNGTGVSEIAITRNAIYVQLSRMGGSGWGVLFQIARPPPRAEEQKVAGMWEIPVFELARYKELLQGLKSLGEADHPAMLCASADESRVYYSVDGKDYLITNGQSEELQLQASNEPASTQEFSAQEAATSDRPEPAASSDLTRPSQSHLGRRRSAGRGLGRERVYEGRPVYPRP